MPGTTPNTFHIAFLIEFSPCAMKFHEAVPWSAYSIFVFMDEQINPQRSPDWPKVMSLTWSVAELKLRLVWFQHLCVCSLLWKQSYKEPHGIKRRVATCSFCPPQLHGKTLQPSFRNRRLQEHRLKSVDRYSGKTFGWVKTQLRHQLFLWWDGGKENRINTLKK